LQSWNEHGYEVSYIANVDLQLQVYQIDIKNPTQRSLFLFNFSRLRYNTGKR